MKPPRVWPSPMSKPTKEGARHDYFIYISPKALDLPARGRVLGADSGSPVHHRKLYLTRNAEQSGNPSRQGIFCNIASRARGDHRTVGLRRITAVRCVALRGFTRPGATPGRKKAR